MILISGGQKCSLVGAKASNEGGQKWQIRWGQKWQGQMIHNPKKARMILKKVAGSEKDRYQYFSVPWMEAQSSEHQPQ